MLIQVRHPTINYFCRIIIVCLLSQVAIATPPPHNPFMNREYVFAAHAPRLACGVMNGVQIWDTRTWELLRTIGLHRQYSNVCPFSLSPDGRTLACITSDSGYFLQIWDVNSGALRRSVAAGETGALLFTPNGGQVIAGTRQGTFVWETRTYQRLLSLPRGNGLDIGLAVSPDSRFVLINGWNGGGFSAGLWDIRTGTQIRAFSNRLGPFSDMPVAFSPDGRLLATGGENPDWKGPTPEPDGSAPSQVAYQHQMKILVWDVKTAGVVRMLPGPMRLEGSKMRFTSDSQDIVSTGEYGETYVWQVSTGKLLRVLKVNGLFAPDGDTVFVGQSDPRAPEPQTFPARIVALNLRTGRRRLLRP